MKHEIRLATSADSMAILSIYAYYVINTTISYETEAPTVEEFAERIENITKTHPYLVYLINGEIVGFAYASEYGERKAYLYSTMVSVYVSHACKKQGVAGKLYTRLFEIIHELGFYNAYCVISTPNIQSETLHKKFGFEEIGVYNKIGYKHGRWLDQKKLEKHIRPYIENPTGVKLISDLSKEYLDTVLKIDLS